APQARGDSARDPKKSCRAPGDPPEEPRQRRERLMQATEELAPQVGIAPVCEALGIPRASLYRRRHPRKAPRRTTPARALSESERREVLQVLHSKRFADAPPAQVPRHAARGGRLPVLAAHDVPP